MSETLFDIAFHTNNVNTKQKFILINVAIEADDSGKSCLSIQDIAELCRMGVRTVNKHIEGLVALGYLERASIDGKPTITRINVTGSARNITSGQKNVLAAIASFSIKSENENNTWPSAQTIADTVGMGVQTVARHTAALLKLGYLERIYRKGKPDITRINVTGRAS